MNSNKTEWSSFASVTPADFNKVNMHPSLSSMNTPTYINGNTRNHIMNVPNWQCPQVIVKNVVGVPQQPLNPQQQQHFMLAQQKAFEEQKKLYEQFRKQRQFDEQKQRLKEFSIGGIKGSASADAMIENILSKPQQQKHPKMDFTTHSDIKASYSAQVSVQQNPIQTFPQQMPPMYPVYPTSAQCSIEIPNASTISQEQINTNTKLHCPKPLKLPPWLTDSSKIPQIYTKCFDVVKLGNGKIDTSKCHSLLLHSNLSPQLLGILWEMVNRTQPGSLEVGEFYGLLALIGLIQRDVQISNPDILLDVDQPISPIIYIPSLMASSENRSEGHANEEVPDTTIDDDDEFADFVSATLPSSIPSKETESQNTSTHPPLLNSLQGEMISLDNNTLMNSINKGSQQEKRMNLPTLGNSPEKGLKNMDDDFNEFQSASMIPNDSITENMSVQSSSQRDLFLDKSQSYPTFDTDPMKDKYAVFKELNSFNLVEEKTQEPNDDGDDGFTDFCGALPSNSINSSNSLNTANTLKASNTWTNDPFGEFEESPRSIPGFDMSSDSGSYVTANASVDTSNDADDDFGEFVKPVTSTIPTAKVVHNSLGVSEIQVETQSVASLELPGLEVTVNLSNETPSNADSFPPSESVPKNSSSNEISLLSNSDHSAMSNINIDKEFDSLSILERRKNEQSTNVHSNIHSSLSSGSLSDKYSVIRSENNQNGYNEPHSISWLKCLEGCQKLLKEGKSILDGISKTNNLFNRVLSTSQMQEYLTNLYEIWLVNKRIGLSATKFAAVSPSIDFLLKENKILWSSILEETEGKLDNVEEIGEQTTNSNDNVCSVCLDCVGVNLCYGGHSYHAPCANFWLNVVDLTLPMLTRSNATLL